MSYHEAGVIILEEVMFGTVSTADIIIYKTLCACQNYEGHGLVPKLVTSSSICF